jgi:outer membrane lipoprotein-sorting protein
MRALIAFLLLLAAVPASAAELDKPAMVKLLQEIDARQRNQGDYHSFAYIEQKERDKVDTVYEAEVYRRSADARFVMLFDKPKSEEGKGYLRIDQNLWMYDPTVGKWERRTERERIGGTNSRRSDFDDSRLAEEYEPKFEGEGKLGVYKTVEMTLTVKEGVDVAFPVVKIWIDQETHNILKRQELALSGKLMRTSYYPKWAKVFSESKKADVWFPQEIRFFDEVEKANSTLVMIRKVELKPLDANVFTKAWLEAKSR